SEAEIRRREHGRPVLGGGGDGGGDRREPGGRVDDRAGAGGGRGAGVRQLAEGRGVRAGRHRAVGGGGGGGRGRGGGAVVGAGGGGGGCGAVPADLSSEAGCAGLAEAVGEREETVQVLVNNAGANWGAA